MTNTAVCKRLGLSHQPYQPRALVCNLCKMHNNLQHNNWINPNYTVQCYTMPLCLPVSVWTSSDVSTSYRLAARSQEAVTTCRPPTNQSAAITTPWWLFRVAVATRTVGTSQEPSPSTSPSSLSDESWSSSHEPYEGHTSRYTQKRNATTDEQFTNQLLHLWHWPWAGQTCFYMITSWIGLGLKVTSLKILWNPRISQLKPWDKQQHRATHSDIWWRLGSRKLHHIAPDVSRLVPGGCANVKYTSTNMQHVQMDTQNWLLEAT